MKKTQTKTEEVLFQALEGRHGLILGRQDQTTSKKKAGI